MNKLHLPRLRALCTGPLRVCACVCVCVLRKQQAKPHATTTLPDTSCGGLVLHPLTDHRGCLLRTDVTVCCDRICSEGDSAVREEAACTRCQQAVLQVKQSVNAQFFSLINVLTQRRNNVYESRGFFKKMQP